MLRKKQFYWGLAYNFRRLAGNQYYGSQTIIVLEECMRSSHSAFQAADRRRERNRETETNTGRDIETDRLAWSFENSKPTPSDTSPPRTYLIQYGHTS